MLHSAAAKKALRGELADLKNKVGRKLGLDASAIGPVIDAANDNVLIPGQAKDKAFRIGFLPKGLHLWENGFVYPTADLWKANKITPTWETHARLEPTTAPAKADIVLGEAFRPLFELGTYRFKVMRGGRGGAKSTAIAIALLLLARANTLRIVCARQFQASIAMSVKTLLDDWIEELGFEAEFSSTLTTITHIHTGSTFHFVGLDRNPASIKSIEGADVCWVEEAHSIVQSSWDILVPTIREKGSELWLSYNPEQSDDPVDAHFFGEDGAPPRSWLIDVGYLDNPHFFASALPEELAHAAKGKVGRFNHIWLGAYVSLSDTTIFSNVRIGEGEDEFLQWEMVQGLDFSNGGTDPHAFIRAYVNMSPLPRERKIFIDFENYGNHALDDLTDIFGGVHKPKHTETRADSAAPDKIQFLQNRGFPVVAAKKGAGSLKFGINWLEGYEIIVSTKCPRIAEEFRRYSWQQNRKTLKIIPEPVDAWNDGIDALRYGCEELMMQATGEGSGAVRLGFGRKKH